MAVIGGLNNSTISRLKFSWEQVDKAANESFKRLQAIFDPSNANQAYRTALHEAITSEGPVMPFL
jgi:hypothetical protein